MLRSFIILIAAIVLFPSSDQAAGAEEPPAVPVAPPPRPVVNYRAPLKFGSGPTIGNVAKNRGLLWLVQNQSPDGSWLYDWIVQNTKDIAGSTGLVLLAFLGDGETHIKAGRYQKTVKTGMDWLCRDMVLSRAQAAIDWLQKTQKADGTWEEIPNIEGASLVTWQVQALQAARLCKDIKVDEKVLKKVIAFLDATSSGPRKASYGQKDATNAAPGTGLTAAGLMCRYFLDGWGPDHAGMAEGVMGIMKRSPLKAASQKPIFDIYFYYHATRVINFFGRTEFDLWNEGPRPPESAWGTGGLEDWLRSLQNDEVGHVKRGSWNPDSGIVGKNWGRLGTTALCVMTLEISSRHLAINKRREDIKDALKLIEPKP